MHRVHAVWHIFCLCKSIFITSQIVALCFSSIVITAGTLEVNLKFSADFRCFDLRAAIIRMLQNGDVSLYHILGHGNGNQITFHRIILGFCANGMHRLIQQISFGRRDFLKRIIAANIFLCLEISFRISGIGVHKIAIQIQSVNCSCKCGVTLCGTGFCILFDNLGSKFFQHILERFRCGSVSRQRSRLISRNNVFYRHILLRNGVDNLFVITVIDGNVRKYGNAVRACFYGISFAAACNRKFTVAVFAVLRLLVNFEIALHQVIDKSQVNC